MAISSAADVLNRFDRRARRLESLVREGQRLRSKGALTLRNWDALRESALLDLYTSLELFAEELFFSVLLGGSGIADAGGVVAFSNREQAEEIFLGGRSHQVWLPFEKGIRPLASRLLAHDGRPFSRLDRHSHELGVLNEVRIVRNAIAHRSASAQKELAPMVADLRRGRKNAAGILEHTQQGVSKQEQYSTAVRRIATALASPDERQAQLYLAPEDPYRTQSKAPTGVYRCDRCQGTHRIRARVASLPKCPRCKARQEKGETSWRRVVGT